ncbi:carboxypeptidase-like regulatory domain-containing protein [Hymenobacter koreensis]|uniref:Carboxypeptidase-like regulatory domain-containing protein n=1 Tax=Hymenobacter koreensis TaxID=1084523 RepID=A0ABP8J6P1_9BACT
MRLSSHRPYFLILLLLALLNTAALAQQVVSGRVIARSTKEPLAQVTVRVEDQKTSAVSDEKGRFSLRLPTASPNAKLTFSHLGFQPLTLPAAQIGTEVALEEQSYLIGEVQVSYVQLQKLLLRQWRIAPASLDAAAQQITARMQAKDPKKAETLAKNPEAVRKVMDMARYEFRPNGIVKTKLLIAGHKLRWQLDEETRTLTIVDEEGGSRKINVKELTADRLVLQTPGSSAPEIAYVPAD